MNGSIFITLSAAILLLLGLAHLFYTFHGNKFDPRDAQLKARLMEGIVNLLSLDGN